MARCERQLHVWVSKSDHAYLSARAAEDETTVGAIVRSLIRQSLRSRHEENTRPHTDPPLRGGAQIR